MSLATFHSWWTVALVILFLGIVAWAWSGKRKKSFEQAARMPLDDEMDFQSLPLSPRGRRDGEVADVRWTSAPSSGRAEACAPRREQGEREEPAHSPSTRGGMKHG